MTHWRKPFGLKSAHELSTSFGTQGSWHTSRSKEASPLGGITRSQLHCCAYPHARVMLSRVVATRSWQSTRAAASGILPFTLSATISGVAQTGSSVCRLGLYVTSSFAACDELASNATAARCPAPWKRRATALFVDQFGWSTSSLSNA